MLTFPTLTKILNQIIIIIIHEYYYGGAVALIEQKFNVPLDTI